MSNGKRPYENVYDDVPYKMPMFCSLVDEEDGSLYIEWRNGDKHLIVYIPDAALDWLKSWGARPRTEMEDRDENPTSFADAYRWLMAMEPHEP